MKILIIEDEIAMCQTLQKALLKERYVVETASDYRTASDKLLLYQYDCILLDIMLPDGNGLDLLRLYKEQKKQGSVIILSAKDSIYDKVDGLELGADDYLAKPFHIAELSARIRSVIRRNNHNGDLFVDCDNIRINNTDFSVQVNDKTLELSRKEFDILFYFINRPNRLIDKMVLAESVWGDYIDQVDNFDFIYAHIKNLRKKLKEAGATPELKAVYGIGYKLITE